MLDTICFDLITRIFSYLDTDDLFNLRLVAKSLKFYAELELKDRKKWFCLSEDDYAKNRFECSSRIYSNARQLCIQWMQMSFQEALEICDANLRKLQLVEIFECSPINDTCIQLMVNCFQNVKSLYLYKLEIDDQKMSLLFQRMHCLRKVSLHYTDVCGSCFVDIGTRVASIDWITSEKEVWDSNAVPPMDNNLRSFSVFCYESPPNSGRNIIRLVTKHMRKLETLKLDLLTIDNFNELYLPNLLDFSLNVSQINGTHCLNRQMNSVKVLTLDVFHVSDNNLKLLLSSFPFIEGLCLNVYAMVDFNMTVVNALRMLRSLKCFSFEDADFHSDYYMIDDTYNALITAIQKLHFVTEFFVRLDFHASDQFRESIITDIEQIAVQRPNCSFNLKIRGVPLPERDYPTNLSLY